MSEDKLDKTDFEELEAVIIKKLRNRKKKLEKIVATENKVVSKEIKPTPEQEEMIASKEKVEQQIQEFEEIRRGVHKESKKIIAKHNKIVKDLKTGEANKENTIKETLGSVADALLVNLLQNEYHTTHLVGKEETVGLEALMIPLKNLFTPPGNQIVYSKAKECFLELFVNFAKGSEDIIPGSDTTYSKLLSDIRNIPAESIQTSYKLNVVESAPVVHHVHVEETKQAVRSEHTHAPAPRQGGWNQDEQQDDEDVNEHDVVEEEAKPTIEQLVEEDVRKDMVKGIPAYKNKDKEFIDEDGFVRVKPHTRPDFEHNVLRGKGRRGGKKGRNGETERLRVNDGKGPRGTRGRGARGERGTRGRGRGGQIHNDKHDIDENGNKIKTAHGKHSHWKKGEVRVEQTQPTE
jgi:hypothetical protein